jgi:hypothetical protein
MLILCHTVQYSTKAARNCGTVERTTPNYHADSEGSGRNRKFDVY